MEFAYSNIGRVTVLYVVRSVSFVFPQCVEVSALRILIDFLAFPTVFWMCLLNVNFGSKVRPRIFGSFMVGSVVLLIWSLSVVLYSAGSGVKRVVVVFDALSDSWFCNVHAWISFRYGCTMFWAISGLEWDVRMVISSA